MDIIDGYSGPPPSMRGQRVKYRPNHRSFGKFILSEQARDVTEEVAKDIADLAGDLAPRGGAKGPVASEEDAAAVDIPMADRFKVNREAGVIKVAGNVRVKVDVFNTDSSAAPNEFGGPRNARHRMLGRAGARFGDFKGPHRFVRPEGI